MTDSLKLSEALRMLYLARWNVPKAADHCGLSTDEMKHIFNKEATMGELLPQKWEIPTTIQLSLGLKYK